MLSSDQLTFQDVPLPDSIQIRRFSLSCKPGFSSMPRLDGALIPSAMYCFLVAALPSHVSIVNLPVDRSDLQPIRLQLFVQSGQDHRNRDCQLLAGQ